jgi:pantoate--beta-alanine ligase
MIISKHIADITSIIENERNSGRKIGFVPTMGALHDGHISLISKSVHETDFTVSSIFVNPAQFNNKADLDKYPVTTGKDIEMLEAAGCDLLFLPSADEIYPADFQKKHYDLGYLETILEGKYRTGHFQGVCQVVDRLLSIIHCDVLFLGQKDYQQCMVIARMIELTGYPLKLKIVPTVRENSGLAMSSRNMRLSATEKETAAEIYQTLEILKKNLKKGALNELKQQAVDYLTNKGFEVDYVELTDDRLRELNEWDGDLNVVALIAASLNNIRLIDNMTIH